MASTSGRRRRQQGLPPPDPMRTSESIPPGVSLSRGALLLLAWQQPLQREGEPQPLPFLFSRGAASSWARFRDFFVLAAMARSSLCELLIRLPLPTPSRLPGLVSQGPGFPRHRERYLSPQCRKGLMIRFSRFHLPRRLPWQP